LDFNTDDLVSRSHRDGKRFIAKADDLLTAFLSLERDATASKGANGNATRQNVGKEYAPNVGTKVRSARVMKALSCKTSSYKDLSKISSTIFPEIVNPALITFPDVFTHLGHG
jgi:hypothetical protein